MKCPRCQSVITASPDTAGFLTCPTCGAHLRSRTAAHAPAPAASPARAASPLADGSREEIPGALGRLGRSPNATLPPGTPLPRIPRPGSAAAVLAESSGTDVGETTMRARRPPAAVPNGHEGGAAPVLETLLSEIREVRRVQEQILELLREGTAAASPPPLFQEEGVFDGSDAPAPARPPAVRARRRKTVLLIDDDAQTLGTTRAALEQAEVPLRTASDGNAALAAIAEEKPDVIVMELGLGGSMAGKDVINMIKATMEWVDIPIVLYTREPIESQKEARTIHGADDFVPKGSGPQALVTRVITLFRKG